jgi:hypothetical protein
LTGHFISFAFVPVHWRVLYINIVSIGFGTILSKVANLPATTEPEASQNKAKVGEATADVVLGHRRIADPTSAELDTSPITPVDKLARLVTGIPTARFWAADSAVPTIGLAWVRRAQPFSSHVSTCRF